MSDLKFTAYQLIPLEFFHHMYIDLRNSFRRSTFIYYGLNSYFGVVSYCLRSIKTSVAFN